MGGQWVDHPPLRGSLKEPFEIKVYEIDDVERLQRREEVGEEVSPVCWFGWKEEAVVGVGVVSC